MMVICNKLRDGQFYGGCGRDAEQRKGIGREPDNGIETVWEGNNIGTIDKGVRICGIRIWKIHNFLLWRRSRRQV